MLALALVALATSVQALSLEHLPPGERVALSDRIVHGEVARLESAEAPEGWIETRITVKTLRMIKGQMEPEVTFTVPGGSMGERSSYVPGVPVYAAGEEVVLFLQTLADGTAMPVGLPQGSFHVVVTKDGGTLVLPDIDSASLDLAAELAGDDGPLRPQPREAFLASVAELVKGAGSRGGDGTLKPGVPPDLPRASVTPAPSPMAAPGGGEEPARDHRPLLLVLSLVVLALLLWLQRRVK